MEVFKKIENNKIKIVVIDDNNNIKATNLNIDLDNEKINWKVVGKQLSCNVKFKYGEEYEDMVIINCTDIDIISIIETSDYDNKVFFYISKNIVKENNINDYIINEDFIVTKIN